MSLPVHVAVVGAGVIGLSVATHLLEKFSNDIVVTVIADKFSPDTAASDRSGGWIFPPIPNDVESERVIKWIKGTFQRFQELYSSKDANEIGLSLVHGYLQSSKTVSLADGKPPWADYVIGFRFANTDQNEVYDCNKLMLAFSTYIVSCPVYLPWMMNRIMKLGGTMTKQKIFNLSELNSYDIVVNCTGIGARELVNDHQMYPVRGHIVSVKAPWIKQWLIRRVPATDNVRRSVYIFPRHQEVILGGSFDINNEDLSTDSNEIEKILKHAQEVMPNLNDVEVLDSWVGVRPMRKGGVRLEKEGEKESGPVIIHCYGHGGDGVSLSWGCAEEVGTLVQESLS